MILLLIFLTYVIDFIIIKPGRAADQNPNLFEDYSQLSKKLIAD